MSGSPADCLTDVTAIQLHMSRISLAKSNIDGRCILLMRRSTNTTKVYNLEVQVPPTHCWWLLAEHLPSPLLTLTALLSVSLDYQLGDTRQAKLHTPGYFRRQSLNSTQHSLYYYILLQLQN